MAVYCRSCGKDQLRLSLFRPGDIFFLLRLCYPVRCRWCHERDIVSLPRAMQIRRDDAERHKDPHQDQETS